MRNLNIALILIMNAVFFSSCGENMKNNSDLNNTLDTVHQQLKGLPLNNLDRENPTDTVGH
ncbi:MULTISPECIES: hypothetical protein [unclassified Sphingobacterium]|uniref:hypothetical protein n=1 Tax=unclassified Sphingobacterium TaxID=2609468 RepID=UPI001824CAD8|nr:hypothetical protein [Sphingobacterium sp. B16(2022)]NJI73475.1 hypothetical protein [Sphingobacterium sp. B16(2022)]